VKVSAHDRDRLLFAIAPLDTEERRDRYRGGDYTRVNEFVDLDKRYRWDLFWEVATEFEWRDDGTEGYRDSHIDTALRSIVPPLNEGLYFDPLCYIEDGDSQPVRF